MKKLTLIVMTTFVMALVNVQPAVAQPACEPYPSSDCPAPGPRGYQHYPCLSGQVKADWNTMLYRVPGQSSYASSGYEINADIWCTSEPQAQARGFRRALY